MPGELVGKASLSAKVTEKTPPENDQDVQIGCRGPEATTPARRQRRWDGSSDTTPDALAAPPPVSSNFTRRPADGTLIPYLIPASSRRADTQNLPDPRPPPFSIEAPPPTRLANGDLVFASHPEFRPNLTPEEILRAGSFGGTYFRPIHSGVTGLDYGDEVWKELPKEWIEGLDVPMLVSSPTYRPKVNKYKMKCGMELREWEKMNLIRDVDPYGWFQWYCRYYQGRRCSDDARQVRRWANMVGVDNGRFLNRMVKMIMDKNAAWDDVSVNPKIRQVLLHWAYELTEEHYMLTSAKLVGHELDEKGYIKQESSPHFKRRRS